MSDAKSRREFLRTGTAAAAGLFAAGTVAQEPNRPDGRLDPPGTPAPGPVAASPPPGGPAPTDPPGGAPPVGQDEYDGFFRYKPSRGNDPDGPFYLGKTVPARRIDGGNAPFVAPDTDKLPWKTVDGRKEFRLVCTPVSREFLPGYWMNVWGFNGGMPGPVIEATQGDKVRIVVRNEYPEPTSVHWHGFEMPVQFDGADTLTQNEIPPGGEFVYELDLHEEGTFYYHSHVPMQEAFGAVGWFIVHPAEPFDPPVDRDFGLIFQNFRIDPMQTVADSWSMDWNWHTINGRSGPYATPLVCRHGERVRVRIMDFSPVQHHPIHMHGHTFWVTGHEGARAPKSAWVPRNTELIAVAQASDFEFVANNPGDWALHCHMVHHMMNHMVRHVGPRIRDDRTVDAYLTDLETRPPVKFPHTDPGYRVPGYPQAMQGMEMRPEAMEKLWGRREVRGMRATAMKTLHGLFTAMRVLPDDLYHRVMETDEDIPKGAVFEEIVRRFGKPAMYEPAPKMKMTPPHGGTP